MGSWSTARLSLIPLQQLPGSWRSMRLLTFVILAVIISLRITGLRYIPWAPTSISSKGVKAQYLSPAKLMERPISKDVQTIPKLIHQTWSSTELPAKFQRWSDTCRRTNPDWEWVLWTDEDNEDLVRTYFPSLLNTYLSLPHVIYRSDLVRNLYMHTFGGVYADLDVECLRPVDQLFSEFNISTLSHTAITRPPTTHQNPQQNGRKALFGRMGIDTNFPHSIPNAWMASTPGHPFFLLVLESVMESIAGGALNGPEGAVEALTGPIRLFNTVNEYQQPGGPYEGAKLDDHVLKSSIPAGKMFAPKEEGLSHSVEVLPFQYIFPYSWDRDGAAFRETCWATSGTFDADRCKLLLGTDHWPSYAITYWSHSWAGG